MSGNAKTGDTVRFLNSVGGGRVVRIDGQIAYVEDEDGFEIPVQLRECVVVNPATSMGFTERPRILPEEKNEPAPQQPQIKDVLNSIETPGGDILNIVLGFEPTDIKTLSHSGFEAYLVNDSNYWLYAVIMSRSDGENQWTLRFSGIIEPNMEENVWSVGSEDLPEMDRIAVQYVAYKQGKAFSAKVPASVELNVDTTKFLKLHCFRPNTYFEGPVITFDIVREDSPCIRKPLPAAHVIKEAMQGAAGAGKDRHAATIRAQHHDRRRGGDDGTVVVDLHATELFDNMRGLTNADILNRQIDRFTEVMEANMHVAGRKIVFIHGKGEGVLRQALLKELSHRFKGHDVQDASFREYGYGATQVTIRPMAAKKAGGK